MVVVREIYIVDMYPKFKNKAIKHILDILDICSMTNKEKETLRSVILDEINELYRNLRNVTEG